MSVLPPNPDPNPCSGCTTVNIYGYVPSIVLAGIALAIFVITFIVHIAYIFPRKWRHCRAIEILLVVGILLELLGYGWRAKAHYQVFVLLNFVLPYVFIVAAPVLFTAAIYVALTSVIRTSRHYPALSPINPKWIVGLYVTVDCVTIFLQLVGSALVGVAASNLSQGKPTTITVDAANDILIAGLAVQNAFFLTFLVLFGTFAYRVHTAQKSSNPPPALSKRFVITILSAGLLIFLRTLFRLAEVAEGPFSSTRLNEHFFAGLEAAPVLLAIVILTVFPIGATIPLTADNEGGEHKELESVNQDRYAYDTPNGQRMY